MKYRPETLKSPIGQDSQPPLVFEKLVTKNQLSDAVELSRSYINKLMALEGLPHYRIGRAVRFRISEVAEWLNKRRYP